MTDMPPLLVDGPEDSARTLVLAHGAGAPMDSPFLETMASGLAARIEAAAVPLSPAGARALAEDPELAATVYGGGEDYELAFAVAPERAEDLAELAARLSLPLTRVGALAAGEGVSLVDESGAPLPLAAGGWTHF